MDPYEDPDPQTITAHLEVPGAKSTDAEIQLHNDKLTVSRNRSAPSLPDPSIWEFSQSSVPGPEATALPIHHDTSTHRVNDFAEPTENGQTLIAGGVPPQREQPQSEAGERSSGLCACLPVVNADTIPTISTVVSHDREAPAERPLAGDLVASSFPLGSDAAATAATQAWGDTTCQLSRSASMITLDSPGWQPVEPDASLQIDNDEPLAGAAPPQQEQPQSHYTKFDTSLSTEVDHVLFLLGGKNGPKQLLQLEPDQAQYCADRLDAVRYPVKLVLQLV